MNKNRLLKSIKGVAFAKSKCYNTHNTKNESKGNFALFLLYKGVISM